MLLQLPREPRTGEAPLSRETDSEFEAGVRRDLAAASIVSYESTLGGWRKRTFDVGVVLISLPLWLPVMLIAALWSKLTFGGPVLIISRCVGYGGRSFGRCRLRVERIADEHVATEPRDAAPPAPEEIEAQRNWVHAFERLPQLMNVLRGEMSLVGPAALLQGNLDQLKSGRRYYLSARPGLFSIDRLVDADHAEGQYKAYALSWSEMLDLTIIWDRLRGFQGRLGKASRVNRVVPGLQLDHDREIVIRHNAAP